MTKKTIPSLRIEDQSFQNMQSAIKKYNKKSLLKMSQNEFIRIAIEQLSQRILLNLSLDLEFGKE